MADPHHVAVLDGLDVLTVRLYRVGLTVAAIGLATLTFAEATGQGEALARWVTGAGAALAVANLHLYDKRIRWFEAVLAWLGLGLSWLGGLVDDGGWTADAGLGFVFAAMSGLALKEQFCFRIPFLRAVPLILAPSLVPVVLDWGGPAAVMHGAAAALFGVLAAAKWTQPLHFDVGDKSRYTI